MFKKYKQTDFLSGDIFLPMIQFAIPLLFSTLFQQLYNTIDTLIVGRTLGEAALAAIGASSPIYDMLIGFALGFGNGLAIVTARCFGSRDEKMLKDSAAAAIVIGVAVVAMITLLSQVVLMPLLQILHTPEEVIDEAYRYISIITRYTLVMFAYNLCAGLLRAIGNSLMPLIFLIISSFANIVLDYVFIVVMGRGLGGAAEATAIAQGISVLLCLIYIAKSVPILIPKKENFKVDMPLYKEMTAQGFSTAFMMCFVSIGSVILQSGINGLGYLTIAAHTAARKLYSFCMMPFTAMNQTVNTFVSQNYGAGQAGRVRKAMKYSYLYNAAVTIIITIVIWSFAPIMIRWISGSDEAVLLWNGTWYLRVVAPCYFILGVLNNTRRALQAIGQKILPVFSSVIELVGKIVFTAYFIPKMQYTAVIICEPVIWCFMVVELLVVFWRDPFIRGGGRYVAFTILRAPEQRGQVGCG
ncbi:MAG: MATE family efflux transporter, partial [Lachnospiraceae bacterium]|nr:MATE family efflux transporter [Lachnospiraceae bacterium]